MRTRHSGVARLGGAGTAPRKPRRDPVLALPTSVRPATGCARRIDLKTFRVLLAYPTWGLVTQFLVTGRWYEKGLDLAFELLACADQHHDALSAHEEARARMTLYDLVLDMLDRLDAWDTYLEVWQQLRQHTAYTLEYGGGAATRLRAQPFVMRRDGDRTYLHFLYSRHHREQLIERKRAKQRAGRRIGNLVHHPQAELSDAELRRRLAWVAQLARSLRRPRRETAPGTAADGSAPPPPADGVPRCAPAVTLSIDVDTLLQELLGGEHGRDESPGTITDPDANVPDGQDRLQ